MTAPAQTPDGFLLGGGAKSARFDTPNTTVTGVICAEPEMRQQTEFGTGKAEFWDDGSPRMQLVVKVQTEQRDDPEDDGIRALYIKGGFKSPTMQKAVADSVRNAGAHGLAVGGVLSVTYTGNGPSSGAGFPPKQYTAVYQAPVAGADFLGAAPQAAAPQQPYTPPVAPVQPAYTPPPTPAPVPAAGHPAPAAGMVQLPDGSMVTPEVAALLGQVQPPAA